MEILNKQNPSNESDIAHSGEPLRTPIRQERTREVHRQIIEDEERRTQMFRDIDREIEQLKRQQYLARKQEVSKIKSNIRKLNQYQRTHNPSEPPRHVYEESKRNNVRAFLRRCGEDHIIWDYICSYKGFPQLDYEYRTKQWFNRIREECKYLRSDVKYWRHMFSFFVVEGIIIWTSAPTFVPGEDFWPEGEDTVDFETHGFFNRNTILGKYQGMDKSLFRRVQFAFKMASESQREQLMDEVITEAVDWAVSGAILLKNPNFTTFALVLVGRLNRIFNLRLITDKLIDNIKWLYNKLSSKQQHREPAVRFETHSGLEGIAETITTTTRFSELMTTMDDNLPTIASVIAGIAVAVTTLLLGKDMLVDTKPLLERFGRMGMSLGGIDRGMTAANSMCTKLGAWITDGLTYMVGSTVKDSLSAVLYTWDVQDSDNFQKRNIFEYIEWCLKTENLDNLKAESGKREMLDGTISVLRGVLQKAAQEPIGLTSQQIAFVQRQANELQRVRDAVFRFSRFEEVRFVPFWINITGAPGTGKSTFMSKAMRIALDILAKHAKYGVPVDPSSRFFMANFTDEYLTSYAQQYCVSVDDLLQETELATLKSSALAIITWISNVPYRTVQADLKDKGIPFTSKMIWSTSNQLYPNRKDINNNSALADRMRVVIDLQFKKEVCTLCLARTATTCEKCTPLVDPIFGKPVEATLMVLDARKETFIPVRKMTGEDFMIHVIKEYMKWFDHQEDLRKQYSNQGPVVDQLAEKIFGEGFETHSDTEPLIAISDGESILTNVVYDQLNARPELNLVDKTRQEKYKIKQQKVQEQIDNNAATLAHYINVAVVEPARDVHRLELLQGVTSQGDFEKWLTERRKRISQDLKVIRQQITWRDRIMHVVDGIKKRPVFLTILAVCGGFMFWRALSSRKDVKPEIEEHVRYQSGRPMRAPRARVVSGKIATHSDDFIPVEYDKQSDDLVACLLSGGMARLKASDGNTFTVFRIKGRWIMSSKHCFANMQDGVLFQLEIPYGDQTLKINQIYNTKYLKKHPTKDLSFYYCDRAVPESKDYTGHIAGDIKRTAVFSTMVNVIPTSSVVPNQMATLMTTDSYDRFGEHFAEADSWTIQYPSQRGQSGSVLVASDCRMAKKIIGMHFGQWKVGSKCYSAFVPLHSDDLEEMDLCDNISMPNADEMIEMVKGEITPHSHFGDYNVLNIGKVGKEFVVTQSKKSKYVPSAIHDRALCTRQPAILSDFDPRLPEELRGRSVLFRNMQGYDEEAGMVDRDTLAVATKVMCGRYSHEMRPINVPVRLLNDDEMVNGVYNGLLKQFDVRTSPGYPWITERDTRGPPGKRQWLDEHVDETTGQKTYTMSLGLRNAVEQREKAAKLGIRVPSVSYACLKDETRPIEKINAGKTRVFVCMPMDYNLLVRKYFGAFICAMHETAGIMPACVGVDAATGWTHLYKRLSRVGKERFEDFDYKHWDTLLHPELFDSFVEVVNTWYGDKLGSENANVRKVLIHEIVFNYIIAGDRLVQKNTGTSSGCAITAELNSYIGDLVMLYCFLTLNEEGDLGFSVDDYFENVELAVYGDDLVKSVSDKFTWFSGHAILPIVRELGMDITTGDKTGINFKYKTINNIGFLKRSFRKEGNIWRAPLDKDVLNDIYQWIHACDDQFAATAVNCDAALREAAQHEDQFYDNLQERLNTRIRDMNRKYGSVLIKPLLNTKDDYLRTQTGVW